MYIFLSTLIIYKLTYTGQPVYYGSAGKEPLLKTAKENHGYMIRSVICVILSPPLKSATQLSQVLSL